MAPIARDDYLATEVMTATPQKLQLMLIEAALRMAERARTCWQQSDDEQASEAIIRCQRIVTEMLCGLNSEVDQALVRKVAGVYLFIFRCLATAQLQRSEEKLGEAVEILKVEQETWQKVCEKHGSKRDDAEQTGLLDEGLQA